MREQNCKRQCAHNLKIGQRQAKGDIMMTLYELLLVDGPVTDKKNCHGWLIWELNFVRRHI